jgi:putative Mn2+ efflux pump MntP
VDRGRSRRWDGDDDEVAKAKRLTNARGLALLGLAFSISLDELAIGFSLGLGSYPTRPAAIIALIAIQTLIISPLGLSLGTRISARLRERLERLTNPVLAALGGYQLTGALIHTGLLTALDTAALATLTSS